MYLFFFFFFTNFLSFIERSQFIVVSQLYRNFYCTSRALSFPNERLDRLSYCLLRLLRVNSSGLSLFYCSTHRNVLTGHRICFFLLFFLASIVSIGLPARPALLSLRLCPDSVCPLSIKQSHPDLTRLLFVFFSFLLLPSSASPRS